MFYEIELIKNYYNLARHIIELRIMKMEKRYYIFDSKDIDDLKKIYPEVDMSYIYSKLVGTMKKQDLKDLKQKSYNQKKISEYEFL